MYTTKLFIQVQTFYFVSTQSKLWRGSFKCISHDDELVKKSYM